MIFLIAKYLLFRVELVGMFELVLVFHFLDEPLEGRAALTLSRICLSFVFGEKGFLLMSFRDIVGLFTKLGS